MYTPQELMLAGAEALSRCWTTRDKAEQLRNLAIPLSQCPVERNMSVYSATGTLGRIYNVGLGDDPWLHIEWKSDSADSILRHSEATFITRI